MVKEIAKCLGVKKHDILVSGEKYHNFKDFISFPDIKNNNLYYPSFDPLPVPLFLKGKSMFEIISKQDILIHYPYNPFQHIVDLLREASIDPKVISIKMTLYRVADKSSVINALINAARNGKKVVVFIEIKARFDEEANIKWARIMQEAGILVIENAPSVKVHCKLFLIKRKEKEKIVYYSAVSTGNFNERNAKLYCDETLITKDRRITLEIGRVFDIFSNFYKNRQFRHLLVAPGFLRNRILRMIDSEIKTATAGKKASVLLKLNSLTDPEMAEKLIAAAYAGVEVTLIVRGACIISPGNYETDGKITAISIVDRFLEHSRIYIFHNNGKPKYYISSADLMTRNLDRRIEVAAPVYDKNLQKRIDNLIKIQLSDNLKSRLLDCRQINEFRKGKENVEIRSQEHFYKYLNQEFLKQEKLS
jgi:polyphosphate kinase